MPRCRHCDDELPSDCQRRLLADPEADLTALTPVLQDAQLAAEATIAAAFNAPYADAHKAHYERRTAVLAKIAEVVAPLRNELTALQIAEGMTSSLRGDVTREIKRHLKTLPQTAAEPATA